MDVTLSETPVAARGWQEANPSAAAASQGRGHGSDEQLAHAAGRGDTAAFDALYQRHHGPLLAFARHMLGRMHDAEDVVQHTFLAADRAFRAGKVPNAVRAWLYTVARNRCVSVLRARRDDVALVRDERVATDGLAAEVEQREELRALLADLRRLPDDQRAALLLAELGDLTHAEVARVIGVRQGKVKALVFQAREALVAASTARSLPCLSIREELSVATGAGLRRRHLRDHLAQCEGCRDFSQQVRAQRAALAVVLPVAPSLGLHEAIVGAAATAGAGTTGAGAISAGSVAAKLLTIAAVGGAAAGGGTLGLTELHLRGGDRPAVARVAPPAPRSADPGVAVARVLAPGAEHGGTPLGVRADRRAKAPARHHTAQAPHRRPAGEPGNTERRRASPAAPTGTPGRETAPGRTQTPPGHAKTPPGQAKKISPGQTKTPPGQAKKTPPGQTKTPPGQAKKTPPGADEDPARADEDPARADEDPARADEDPARPSEDSARADEDPARPSEDSTQSDEDSTRPSEHPIRAGQEPAPAERRPRPRPPHRRRHPRRRARRGARTPLRPRHPAGTLRSRWPLRRSRPDAASRPSPPGRAHACPWSPGRPAGSSGRASPDTTGRRTPSRSASTSSRRGTSSSSRSRRATATAGPGRSGRSTVRRCTWAPTPPPAPPRRASPATPAAAAPSPVRSPSRHWPTTPTARSARPACRSRRTARTARSGARHVRFPGGVTRGAGRETLSA